MLDGDWSSDVCSSDLPELLDRLKEAYLDTEAILEDRMGDVKGDFQGGSVDVMTKDDVDAWAKEWAVVKEKMKDES
jgi:cobaltochelatase CobN